MAVPKCKSSKSRRDSRAANWKVSAPSLVECPNCHELIQPHRACPSCGYYGQRKVVEIKTKSND